MRRTSLVLAIISILLITPALISDTQLVNAQKAGCANQSIQYWVVRELLWQIPLPSDWPQPTAAIDPMGYTYHTVISPQGDQGIYITYLQSPAQAGLSLRQIAENIGNNIINQGGKIEAHNEGLWDGLYPAQQLIGQTPPYNGGLISPMSYYFIEANGIVYWLMVVQAPGLMNQNIQNIATCFEILTLQPQGPSQSLPQDIQNQIRLMQWQQAFQMQRDSFVVMSNILSSITP